jgi:hypothetical protein
VVNITGNHPTRYVYRSTHTHFRQGFRICAAQTSKRTELHRRVVGRARYGIDTSSERQAESDLSLLPGWQAFVAGTAFSAASLILMCASMTADYEVKDWYVALAPPHWNRLLILPRHVTLMTIFVALLAAGFNTFAARRLPMFEGMILYLHILLWFGVSSYRLHLALPVLTWISTTFRPGSWRLRYQPLKCSPSSKTMEDGQLWVQQWCSASSPRPMLLQELIAPLTWRKRCLSPCTFVLGVPVLTPV